MTIDFHDPPRLPRGFSCAARAAGLKADGALDLALFYSETPCAAAALFTRNHVAGAPIVVGRELIRDGVLRAIVVNSKVSNVATGAEGIASARRMGAAAAQELDVPAEQVLMSSTGVIGVPLPVDLIERALRGMRGELQDDPLVAARAMMTTDTHPKALSCSVGHATIAVVAKGAGMISPDLATMLAYVLTDAELTAAEADALLRDAARDTVNMLSVDTDTSTSDTCALLANGRSGRVDGDALRTALRAACTRMTEILARDGEGATKLIRARVTGARDEREARRVARSLVDSPLVKTMAFGADPNVGRILMAVGKCTDCTMSQERIQAWLGDERVVRDGRRASFDDEVVRSVLARDPLDLRVELGIADGEATAFGCDLTPGYIAENAAYYSS